MSAAGAEAPALQPYRPLQRIAEGVHCVDGWWKKSPMGRRMTVLGLSGGELAIHSAIRMSEPDMQAIDGLGTVAYVIAPNSMHASDAPWYAARYPGARVLVPAAARARQQSRMRIDGTVEDWPTQLRGHLEGLSVQGLRGPETVYLHRASRTLVVTDLVFNFGDDHFHGIARLLMRLNGAIDRFGPSRLLRYLILRDRPRFRRSLEQMMQWSFDRVIVSHGRILESGGKARMAEAFAFVLG